MHLHGRVLCAVMVCIATAQRFVHELAGMVLRAPTHDFLVEALACLGNIAHPDVLFSELISRHGLLDFIMKVNIL